VNSFVARFRSLLHPYNPRWLFKTKKIDAPLFLSSWEPRWNSIADPSNDEVLSRIKQLNATTVAEIGAGYGRVSHFLADSRITVFPVEPNQFLIEKIGEGVYESEFLRKPLLCPAGKIPSLPVDLYFSVRALEYCNFFELGRLSLRLKKDQKPLISWERAGACARLRIISWLTLNKKIYIQTLIR
jgi:hypothetical protein